MELNLPLNIIYDRTLNNCPECGSNDIFYTYSIHQKKIVRVVVLNQNIDLNY